MISSGWKVNEIEYVKVRLKWWHIRKTKVANIKVATSTGGLLYLPHVATTNARFMSKLQEAMAHPILNPDDQWYTIDEVKRQGELYLIEHPEIKPLADEYNRRMNAHNTGS